MKRKVSVGDVILIPQSNGKSTGALVLGLWPGMESVMTIALLTLEIDHRPLLNQDQIRRVAGNFSPDHIWSVVSTSVAPIEGGYWLKVGAIKEMSVGDLLPEKPFRTGSLVGCKYEGSPLVEGLVEAYRGLTDWNAMLPGRPGYLKSLVFNER